MENSSCVRKFNTLLQQIIGDQDCLQHAVELMKRELKNQLNTVFNKYYAVLEQKKEELARDIDGMAKQALKKLAGLQKSLASKRGSAELLKRRVKESDGKRQSLLEKQLNAFNDSLVELDRQVQSEIEVLSEQWRSQLLRKEHWRVLEQGKDPLHINNQSQPRKSTSSLKRFRSSDRRKSSIGITSKHSSNLPSKFARVNEEYNMQPRPEQKENYESHFGLESFSTLRRGDERRTQAVSMDLTLNPSSYGRSVSVDRSRSKSPERKLENQLQIQHVQELIRTQQPPVLLLTGLHIRDFFIPSIMETFHETNKKFGVLKLTKNELTDEGLRMILKSLRNYPYLHTINLTSNLLTEECFEAITRFRHKNRVVCHYYLSGNRINAHRCRGIREKLSALGINVYF